MKASKKSKEGLRQGKERRVSPGEPPQGSQGNSQDHSSGSITPRPSTPQDETQAPTEKLLGTLPPKAKASSPHLQAGPQVKAQVPKSPGRQASKEETHLEPLPHALPPYPR